ncbi:universal stress protein [Aureimonas fodinaquatilis]|nr:universal stress protein [Aureimonas fodinaquatilis]
MSIAYKTILLTLLPEAEVRQSASPATRLAIEISRHFEGQLTIDYLSPQPAWAPYSLITSLPGQMMAEQSQQLADAAEASTKIAETSARDAGVPVVSKVIALDFLALVGRAALRAQLQDIVVIDGGSSTLRDEREIVEALLFRSGRPVIRVPEGGSAAIPEKILIAWDGSVPAIRAVREALPLLHAAKSVEIVTVLGEKNVTDHEPAAKAVHYLAAHGITATETTLHAAKRNVAETLRTHAVESGADMMVMGTYAHSRMQQAVLGGITTELLHKTPVTLFLAH